MKNVSLSFCAGLLLALCPPAGRAQTVAAPLIPQPNTSAAEDTPRYGWRGFMLDEVRHFFGKETVKQYLDLMASLKMNRFHWHLTDEQAWRIEIKKYPKLTSVGASGTWSNRHAPPAFYTQDDIREIVAYAAERHIMVIPEIDMPGHATAATRAYPELSGGGSGQFAGFTFHPAKEATYTFIDNVLAEIAALFPAPYIHIGADEVHYGNQDWATDSLMVRFARANGLKGATGLEHYFLRRVCGLVRAKGKKMIGWDEILGAGISPADAVVMWWRHDKPAVLTEALKQGYQVVLCPRIPCYFDFIQDRSQKTGRTWSGAFVPLEASYGFPESIAPRLEGYGEQVLGIQANLWTERVADRKRLDYMVLPRLLAIAEAGWTNAAAKSYESFLARLRPFLESLKAQGFYFFDPFAPETTPEPWGPDKADVLANG